jgi:protein-S-isoprenylcysteine O-methyltransferase Ste14
MKKIANWLLWVAVGLVSLTWIYAFYLNIAKEQVNSVIADGCWYATLVGTALVGIAIGLYFYGDVKMRRSAEWQKEKPKRDAERTGRWELARYRMKHRYLAIIINILFIAGMVAWGWNTNGWLPTIAILCIFGSVLVFGYYMHRADKGNIVELNKIREKHGIPSKDKSFTFWQYLKP